MNIKKLASVAMCTLAFVCAASALGEGTQSATSAIEESEQTVLSSIAGGQVLDAGDKYYIAISELPTCADGTVLVYDKTTGDMAEACYCVQYKPDGVRKRRYIRAHTCKGRSMFDTHYR